MPPPNGSRPASIRSPSRPSSAGSSVSAPSTETTATIDAPAPRLRSTESGGKSIDESATATATPLNATARAAVAPTTAIASDGPCPDARSSRRRETTKSA